VIRTTDLFLKLVGLLLFLPMECVASFIRLEVRGREHMPEGAYLLCPTHKGDLDAYFIRRALLRPGSGKRNRYFFRLKAGPWVQRVFLLYWRGWIVDASGPNVVALHGALDWLNQENPVTIFPEGLEHGQEVLHLGAALLACRSGRPIIPLRIDRGVFVKEATPFYALPFLTLLNYLREAPRVTLAFCEPLQPDLERYHREGRRYLEVLSKQVGLRLFGREVEIVG
jgi:1-acyl-sn-glycerol-3-phosphate acyltransferase